MIKEKSLIIPLSATAYRRFTDLGYDWTNKEELEVKVEDLSTGSSREITAICDECGKETKMQYRVYLKRIAKHEGKYFCKECFNKNKDELKKKAERTKKTCLEKYGVENAAQTKEAQEKMKKTLVERYGTENVMKIPSVVEKNKATNLERYGVENILCSPDVIEKSRQVRYEKYGVYNMFELEEYREKRKNTCLERYGVEYASQSPEIREKMQAAFAKSGKTPVSKPQQLIYEMLLKEYEKVEINYPVSNLSLDCFVEINGVKIDIEYDGWFWHKNKQRDFARDKALLKLGYKTLRIKGGHDIPTIEQLKEKIEILVNTERYFEQIFLKEYLKEEKKKNI